MTGEGIHSTRFNISTVRTLIIIMLLMVELVSLSTFIVDAQDFYVDIWTNKGGYGINNLDGGVYGIGEYITIYIRLSLDADRVRYIIIKPDGSLQVIYDGPLKAGTYTDEGIIGTPPGVRRAIVEAWRGEAYAYDEVRYTAIGCPSHGMYLGVNIEILNDEEMELTGWFKPTGISWNDFVNLCWNIYPGRDYYLSYLRNNLLNPMFGIKSASTIGGGIDESRGRVWLKLRVKFRELSLSNYELKILRFKDPIKSAGKGYVDEVYLSSFKDFWKVSPQPTSMTGNSAYWVNRDANSAPLEYEVYLYPILSVRIGVEGLPPDISISVLVNGVDIGKVSVGKYLELNLISGEYIIQAQPEIIEYAENTRYRCKSTTYRITESGEVTFRYIIEHKVKISILSPPSDLGLMVDGTYYRFEELPFEDWWEHGSTHRIVADYESKPIFVSDIQATVFRFFKWSDGIRDHERIIHVSESIELIAIYSSVTQYYVEVRSDYGIPMGSGWYDEGDKISIGLKGYSMEDQYVVVYLSSVERAIFQGWSGDLTSLNVAENLVVDSPKFIKANWRKQYYVEAKTDWSNTIGSGWYYEGEEAKISLVETIVYAPDGRTRYIFDGWEGDYSSDAKEFSILVNRPMIIEARWFTEYLVSLSTRPDELAGIALEFNEKWVRSGSILSVTARSEIQISDQEKYVFNRWIVDGMTSAFDKIDVSIEKPTQLIAEYDPWYYLEVISDYGTVSGSGWYKAGSEAMISIEPLETGFLITQIFEGWSLDDELLSETPVHVLVVNRPLTVTAVWRTDYTGLAIVVVTLGLIIGVISVIKIWKISVHSFVLNIPKMILKKKMEPEVRRYDACINCGTILPPNLEGNVCPSCGASLISKMVIDVPVKCPNCGTEIPTIEFGPQLKQIRCSECGTIIMPRKADNKSLNENIMSDNTRKE